MPNYFLSRLFNPLKTIFTCALLGASLQQLHGQQIAITWDDLPSHSSLPPGETRAHILQSIVDAMRAANLPPVYGFVNGIRVEQEPASEAGLAIWEKAGLPIGNHTWSHMNLNEHTAQEWEADFLQNEAVLKKYAGGHSTHWVRFPYLAEGDTDAKRNEVRAFLAKRHYRIAGVTMSFEDYAFNAPYARCVVQHNEDAISTLETEYLAAADHDITDRRALAKQIFGHDIPYVLLMHVGALDARMLPQLLALYKQRGFTFITLEQAEADPFYANDLNLKLPAMPDTLEAAAAQKHIPQPKQTEPRFNPEDLCK